MLTDIDKNMMIKFLEKNYHVSRIKHKLIDLIKLFFSCDDEASVYIVNSYLHSK